MERLFSCLGEFMGDSGSCPRDGVAVVDDEMDVRFEVKSARRRDSRELVESCASQKSSIHRISHQLTVQATVFWFGRTRISSQNSVLVGR